MSYSSEVLADSPLAYYRLGESSGTTMADSSGNGRNGSYVGGPTLGATGLLTGDADTAVDFPANAAKHGLIADAAWMDSSQITITALIKADAIPTTYAIVDRDGNPDRVFQFYVLSNGHVRVIVWNQAGSLGIAESSGSIPTGATRHVGFTWDGTTIRIYINGAADGTASLSGTSLKVANQPIVIGAGYQGSGGVGTTFDGVIDEVAIYGTALSAARILAQYTAATTAGANSATLAGTMQASTAAFTVATVLAASLAGTAQPPTAAFNLSASAQASLAGVAQAPTGSFAADVAATVIDASLAGNVQPSVGAFALSVAAQVTLAGTAQAATSAFTVSTADRTISLAGSARRATAAMTLVGQPALSLVGTTQPPTGVFTVDAQPTATLAGTVQPMLATFVTYVVTPVTPSPVVGAQSVVVGRAFGAVTMQGSQAVYNVSSAYIPRARQRIVVDGIDVTYFRGGITPDVTYTLLEPLLYGPATLDVPQVSACFERLGVGDLSWLRPGAPVEVQRALDDEVVSTDWKGVVVAFDTNGRNLSVELGGEVSGRAALRDRQPVIFPRVNDLGRQMADVITDLGLPFFPHLGPVTGIEAMTTGGVGHLEHIQALVAKAWTRAGRHWTIMPDESTGAYEAHRKDDETIHATAFIDDAKTVANLRRDISEEPNRIFVTGVTPQGQRIRFGVYPGLVQGPTPDFPGHMEMGDSGDGVRLLIGKLHAMGYLKLVDAAGGYDQDVYDAVVALQIDAGLFDDGFTGTAVPGEVNAVTWAALYDLGVTENSLEWAHIEPAAQRRKVRPWNRAGTGGIMGVNPDYDPNHLVRDRTIDMGVGFTRSQLREFARTVLHDSDAPNWIGDITFNTGALIRGDGFEGMTVTEADVMDARELRPGMNIHLQQFDGGTLFHVAACQVDGSGIVTATVDTRFRDALEVWEIIARNKESRNDPARSRQQKHRSSTIQKDSIGEWDEIGGLLPQDFHLKPGWNVFETVAAMEGTISEIEVNLDSPAEFACAVFGRTITADRLNNLVPKPLTNFGGQAWEKKSDELKERMFLVAFGTKDEPCGYSPGRKMTRTYDEGTDEEITVTTNDPTGKFVDDGGFRYASANRTELTIAVWVEEANMIPLGRILRPQLEAAA